MFRFTRNILTTLLSLVPSAVVVVGSVSEHFRASITARNVCMRHEPLN